jgi:hypothetical protein
LSLRESNVTVHTVLITDLPQEWAVSYIL